MIGSMFFYFLKLNSIKNFILFVLILPLFLLFVGELLQSRGITSFDMLFIKMSETTKNLAYGNSVGSVFQITGLGTYLLYFIPNLFTTLFRPMPWDIRNPFTLMAAIENVILFYLSYKYIFKNWKDIYSNKYLKFLILFIFSWSLLYVIISPANLGGAARFKLQVLPAMIMIIGIAMSMRKQNEDEKTCVE
jgi:amino acid permease